MWVYRVENEEGKGPYLSMPGKCDCWQTTDHNRSWRHPLPEDDIREWMGSYTSLHLFGFKDKRQLYSWFSQEELNNLNKLGFVVKKMKAKEILYGGYQIAFIPDRKDQS